MRQVSRPVDGARPDEINVRDMDPRRYGKWASGDYAIAKSVIVSADVSTALPGEYRDAGRPTRVTPLYEPSKSRALYGDTTSVGARKVVCQLMSQKKVWFSSQQRFEFVSRGVPSGSRASRPTGSHGLCKYEVSGPMRFHFMTAYARRIPSSPGAWFIPNLERNLESRRSDRDMSRRESLLPVVGCCS